MTVSLYQDGILFGWCVLVILFVLAVLAAMCIRPRDNDADLIAEKMKTYEETIYRNCTVVVWYDPDTQEEITAWWDNETKGEVHDV